MSFGRPHRVHSLLPTLVRIHPWLWVTSVRAFGLSRSLSSEVSLERCLGSAASRERNCLRAQVQGRASTLLYGDEPAAQCERVRRPARVVLRRPAGQRVDRAGRGPGGRAPAPGQFSCCPVWGVDWGVGRFCPREIEASDPHPRPPRVLPLAVLERTARFLSMRSQACVSSGVFSGPPSAAISPIGRSAVPCAHRGTRCICCQKSGHSRRDPSRVSTVPRCLCRWSRLLGVGSSFGRSSDRHCRVRAPHAASAHAPLSRFALTSASTTCGQTLLPHIRVRALSPVSVSFRSSSAISTTYLLPVRLLCLPPSAGVCADSGLFGGQIGGAPFPSLPSLLVVCSRPPASVVVPCRPSGA